MVKKLGLIINPIAGMGGSVGLKGTDNMLEEAILRGAKPKCNERTKIALQEVLPIKDDIEIYTYDGDMGGDLVKDMGFKYKLLNKDSKETSSKDTINLANKLIYLDVDMILFAGGDGTARDICSVVGDDIISLGIPGGVKIYSSVYAKNPRKAGQLTKLFMEGKISNTKEEEVLDIDEELYRKGCVSTSLFGYMKIPYKKNYTQNRKVRTPISELTSQELIAHEIIENMDKDTLYLIGAGTTTRAIMEILDVHNTLIGIDLVYNKKLVDNDLAEADILKYIDDRKVKLVITITGNQGYILGRGNQQLSPNVIRNIGKENIIIISTKSKLQELKGEPLFVDTSDLQLDKELQGYYKVITGYKEYYICKVIG